MSKQKEFGIWLDDGTIMYKLKITKGSNITWETADSADIEKAGEVVTEKMQGMVLIQNSSRQYDRLRREMENNMMKGRDEYPTAVTSAYNLMLEWQTEPGSMQGGSVQYDNHLAFAKHNDQGDGERTAKIYKNITCYKCGQLGHYSVSCPLKEDEQ